jgi:hypothetical protein
MPTIEIITDYRKDETMTVEYEHRGNGWHVKVDGVWRQYAALEASEDTVRVLLRKKYSDLY